MRQVLPKLTMHTGLTLVELLIAMTLGQLVVLIISAAVTANYVLYTAASDVLMLHEMGRATLDNMAQSIRHAGYINRGRQNVDLALRNKLQPAVFGLDAHTVPATSHALDGARPGRSRDHSSDVLALRFASDGGMTNCAGLTVSDQGKSGNADQAWSIFYVANDQFGTPNLYCKFNSGDQGKRFTAQSIAQGVDVFRVRYQLDSDNRFVNAAAIAKLDASLPDYLLPARSNWNRVKTVKIALLIHGNVKSALHRSRDSFQLFDDDGSFVAVDDLKPESRRLARAIFRTTVTLRNPQH